LRIVWVGKYQLYYHEPIARLSEVLRIYPGLPVTIDLYGQVPPDASVEVPGRVVYRGPFEDAALLAILRQYDFGLLTYSFDELTRAFMRYSFPGKLIDYLSVGLPVITISPRGISVCDDIVRHDIGPSAFTCDRTAILEVLKAVVGTSKSRLEGWCRNSLAWALEEFVLETGIREFRKLLGSLD
jgi:hypothetical protein